MIEFNIKDTGWFHLRDEDEQLHHINLTREEGRALYDKLKKIYWPVKVLTIEEKKDEITGSKIQ